MFLKIYICCIWCSSFVLASIVFQDVFENFDDQKYLIDTPGCKIPNMKSNVTQEKRRISDDYCGERRIFVEKISDATVRFLVKNGSLDNCQYRFMFASSHSLRPDMDVIFNYWLPFGNGTETELKSDFIEVQCLAPNQGDILYEDVYGIIRKIKLNTQFNDQTHWNVLVIGMDTMSRNRALMELPKTVAYFRKEGWLDFRAYNKVAENTLPNVLSILTNKNISSLNMNCQLDMYSCNNDFIWSHFKAAGYATAYGDDQSMASFSKLPTDHYLKTLFLSKRTKSGPDNCLKRQLAASHVFDYALDFMDTYKREKFFGYFWVTTLSHETNRNQSVSMFDDLVKSLFYKLIALDVLDNTFVVFHSDHGFRFTHYGRTIQSYYESRLPMFFMKVPNRFQRKYPLKYTKIYHQQHRLIAPFDFHLTLRDIAENFTKTPSDLKHEGCVQCTSLFRTKSLTRTCADAGINDTWCACRELKPVSVRNDSTAFHSLALVMLRLYNITENIQTEPMTRCQELSLWVLLRVHTFAQSSKTFYVIAGTLRPDATGFEATVSKVDSKYEIVSLEITTSYERTTQCVLKSSDRVWCVCVHRNATAFELIN